MLKSLLDSLKSATSVPNKDAGEQIVPDLSRIMRTETPNTSEGANSPPDTSTSLEMAARQTVETDDDLMPPEKPEPIYGSPSEMAERAAEAVDSLAGQHDNWMESDLLRLNEAWSDCKADSANPEKARKLFMTAHNIRGVASSYGYPAISRLCGSLCKLLADTKPGENQALINLHVEACRAAFNPLSQSDGADSVADAVCEALEQKVDLMVVS